MLGPFFLALGGLALFILLNLILRLSDLMVDRGIGLSQLLRLLILWMPELIAWAIPMAALFAVFLGLGRMEHDREVMAFESMGVSLRRILLPILIAAIGLSVLTFAVYNWAMPASKQAAQRTYREILFSQSVPRISANTFFTGSTGQYFYVRQYDADSGSVSDVLIYDVTGQLFPQAESQITMVTANTGKWADETWELHDGRMYGFNRDGLLSYSGTFDALSLPVGQTADQLWAQSKSPTEMGILELASRIRRARTSGLSTNEYIVELHQRFALPLSAVLFVLVGGVVSLMFGSKNRSTGIIIGLLLIGLYQGAYLWTQALGRRGAMDPVLAAWIPNVLFGIVGTLLFARVDRLASRDMWNRLRNRLPFLTLLLVMGVGLAGWSQETPLHLECDDLFISADQSEIRAEGAVRAELADALLQADALDLLRSEDGTWTMEANGTVRLDLDDFLLEGDSVRAQLDLTDSGLQPQFLASTGFSGQSAFENSAGEINTLYFVGEVGTLNFEPNGDLSTIEIRRGEVTTCNCCDLPFRSQPYTLRANRLIYYPDQLIVAFGLTGRIGGVSTLWLPVYVQPLEDTLESPLFPSFGRSNLRGWYLKWNVPFYLSESLFGNVLLDYYTAHNEVAAGLNTRYAFAGHEGRFRIYSFPAVVGDPVIEFSASHSLPSSGDWEGSGSIRYRAVGDATELDYGAEARAQSASWSVDVSAAREVERRDTDDDDASNDIIKTTDRFPEVALSRAPWKLNALSIAPHLNLGRFRERTNDEPAVEATRLGASLDLGVEDIEWNDIAFTPRLKFQTSAYLGDAIAQTLSTVQLDSRLRWRSLTADYDLILTRGTSPFDFDAEVAIHRIGVSFTRSSWAVLEVSGGYDLAAGTLDPLSAELAWTHWADWTLEASYQLATASLSTIQLSGRWRSDALRLALDIPYQPVDRQFGALTFSAEWPGEALNIDTKAVLKNSLLTITSNVETQFSLGPLELSGSAQLENIALEKLLLEGAFLSRLGWGARAQWSYSGGSLSLGQVLYGLFWDIGDCLRLGIDREAADTWIYLSILAFPEAVLRYAPESASLQLSD